MAVRQIGTRVFAIGCLLAMLPTSGMTAEPGSEYTVILPGDVPMVLVKIPAGTFMMGSPPGERGNVLNNEIQHQVTLTQDYYIGKTEITQEQWQAVMGSPISATCGDAGFGDNFPAYCITWLDIAGDGGFVEKLNDQLQTDLFRLPTEAEWERAARAETTTRYSYGDALECGDVCEPCATHDKYVHWCGNSPSGTSMVGTKDPNPYGLHDMHGSLWEFVQDRYEDLTADNKTDPTGPTMGNDRVIRGGDWSAEAQYLRSASRVSANPGDPGIEAANTGIGFRLATSSVAGLGFQINAGLNDAWFNPSTPGQGFFVTVFPDIDRMFLAWFTYDTERPPENVMAQLGEPGHRWLTAFGPYVGDTATLDIEVTSGGVFDSAEPMTSQVAGGTINVQFSDCENGLVTFDITSIDQQGEVPIQRIALDNVANCESLSGQ